MTEAAITCPACNVQCDPSPLDELGRCWTCFNADPTTAPLTPVGFPLLSIADLAKLPPPAWLLQDMLPVGFNVLFGPSNVGKSFLALDWSLCIAAGLPWYGQVTTQGPVLYIAAEGVAGIYRRVKAWIHARNQPAPDQIRFIAGAANFLDASDVQRATTTIASMADPPRLIVVDTMARCMVGGDENSAKDVGRFIAATDELGAICNAARLIVHHTGKDGEDERGSSALRGAADAMLALKPDGASARLECAKAKDSAPFDPWNLHLETVLESCVFRCGTNSTALAPAERQILAEVSAAFGTNYTSSTAILAAANVPKSSYYRSLKSLTDRGFLEAETAGRNPRYRLTESGLNQVVPSSPTASHETDSVSPTAGSLYRTVGLETPNGTNELPDGWTQERLNTLIESQPTHPDDGHDGSGSGQWS